MNVFITGTDTNVGKTLICSWLCLHTSYGYFKPIQTGSREGKDSTFVKELTSCTIYQETYLYKEPLSPHLASRPEEIDIANIKIPRSSHLIIEGAGGVLVPINKNTLMVDLISYTKAPVILVARSTLGTINHTLLSLEALHKRNISVLGVIVSGIYNKDCCEAIEFYGNTTVLAQVPFLQEISKQSLLQIPLPPSLQTIFKGL